MPWVWFTMRKLTNVEHLPPASLAEALLTGESKHRVHEFKDVPALLNTDCGLLVAERDANESFAERSLVIIGANNEPLALAAETLEEFAAKVGAPPRPRTEIPSAFQQ